jgi:hypothetical protein
MLKIKLLKNTFTFFAYFKRYFVEILLSLKAQTSLFERCFEYNKIAVDILYTLSDEMFRVH